MVSFNVESLLTNALTEGAVTGADPGFLEMGVTDPTERYRKMTIIINTAVKQATVNKQ